MLRRRETGTLLHQSSRTDARSFEKGDVGQLVSDLQGQDAVIGWRPWQYLQAHGVRNAYTGSFHRTNSNGDVSVTWKRSNRVRRYEPVPLTAGNAFVEQEAREVMKS